LRGAAAPRHDGKPSCRHSGRLKIAWLGGGIAEELALRLRSGGRCPVRAAQAARPLAMRVAAPSSILLVCAALVAAGWEWRSD